MIRPRNIVTASTPIISSVVAALRPFGLRNAGTPLLIASTPVSAALPEENARLRVPVDHNEVSRVGAVLEQVTGGVGPGYPEPDHQCLTAHR
jgi:hypothetical protein